MVEKHKNYLCAEPFLPPWIHLFMIFKDLLIQTNLPTSIFSMSDDFGSKKTNLCRPNSWQLLWAAKRSKSRSASLASTNGRTDASQSFFAFVSFSPHLTWSIILADAGGAEEEKESSTPTVSMTLNSCLEEEGGIEIVVWSVLEFELLFLDHTFKFQYEWLCLSFLVLVSSGPRH